jgi:RNA polymerase sigma-B factor
MALMSTVELEVRPGHEHDAFRRFAANRDPALREALVRRYMPLATHLARRYPVGSEGEDVQQVASLALVKAVDRFDPDRGTAFTSYATPTILGEIKRYFRDFGWAVRVPRDVQELSSRVDHEREALTAARGHAPSAAEVAEALGEPLEDVLEALMSGSAHYPATLERRDGDDDDERPATVVPVEDPGFGHVEDSVCVDSLLALLTPRERVVLRLRFNGGLLQREIAELIGTSQMQVSRMLAKALGELHDMAET